MNEIKTNKFNFIYHFCCSLAALISGITLFSVVLVLIGMDVKQLRPSADQEVFRFDGPISYDILEPTIGSI